MSLLIPIRKEIEGQAKLMLKGFGLGLLKPKLFNPDFKKMAAEQQSYEQIDLIGYDKKGGLFGNPIWDTVKLITPNYTNDAGVNIGSSSLTLDIALLEISNDRNIVKTKIAGRNGTIKEYMSDGDYDITIKGSLVGELANTPPVDLLKTFTFISTCPEAVTVESNLLSYFNVYYLVIEKPRIKQRKGSRNIYDFELTCVSDEPFDLDVTA